MNKKVFEFKITENPISKELDFLTDQINKDSKGHGSAYPFAIFLRNQSGEMIAGCNGSIVFGSIYTDQLWVDPNYRNQGIGKEIMEAVHKYGKKQGCILATVTTMDFQAPNFYNKLGYLVDFSRKGYQKGASCIFMSKKL